MPLTRRSSPEPVIPITFASALVFQIRRSTSSHDGHPEVGQDQINEVGEGAEPFHSFQTIACRHDILRYGIRERQLLFSAGWRKVLEHLAHALVELFDVLVGAI
jgi:hypothetical protein